MLVGWKAAVNDRKIASHRYRVESPVRSLRAMGHAVEVFDPQREAEYDVVIFAKTYSLADRALAGRVRARGGRVVFDLCDNHFYNPNDVPKYRQVREELLDMLSLAQQVVCTTPLLARIVSTEAPWAAEPVVIGDAVEPQPSTPHPTLSPFTGTRLLWFGSQGSPNASAGMADILLIKDRLAEAAAHGPLELVVCSNSREKYEALIAPLSIASRYIEWSLDGFPGVLASADAVIIPISANPFTACKTHNRLTTALQAGVPVIADSIESYREFAQFCTLDDWQGGLLRIMTDPAAERARAAAGRLYIERHCTSDVLAAKWEAALGLTPPAPQRALTHEPAAMTPRQPGWTCQGALDPRANGAVTGWVRRPANPSGRLAVRLMSGQRALAEARADQPRPDLAAAGFPDALCGFQLTVPDEAREDVLRVVVEGAEWGFQEGEFRLAPAGPDLFRLVAADGAGAQAAAAASPGPGDTPGQSSRAAAALAVQAELLRELEDLNALMDSARETAARLVIAAGDDVVTGRRLLGVFADAIKPQLGRVLALGDQQGRSASH